MNNMASVGDLVATSGLKATQIVVGMVMETTGIVTDMPGYDFKVTVHTVSKDDNVLAQHHIIVPSDGLTLAEFRLEYVGKSILTVQDEHGRAITPVKGRCFWREKR